jgi:hypothetical protein
LLALDPQVMREAVDNDCLENVNALPQQLSGCVVWTKQDLVEAGAEIVSPQLIDRGVVGRWPVFRSRHDEPATLLKPIEHLLSKLTNT